jgi:SAM-dependent methyltransferase
MTGNKLYWIGNAAKSRIISDILRRPQTSRSKEFLIFDYGCGTGGDWPYILSENRHLNLLGYDPNEMSIEIARARLKGLNAELYTGNDLLNLNFKADFIVSFSVLEHVYDRRDYLHTAKKHLAEDGIFYLNYDDGHFRNLVDLSLSTLLMGKCWEWLRDVILKLPVRMGRASQIKRRVMRDAIDDLIEETGFKVVDAFYSNLSSFKSLFKTIPEEKREGFSIFWVGVEDELNKRFVYESQSEAFGDRANLWKVMVSRVVVLCHNEMTSPEC